jgi:hypothetical protein
MIDTSGDEQGNIWQGKTHLNPPILAIFQGGTYFMHSLGALHTEFEAWFNCENNE